MDLALPEVNTDDKRILRDALAESAPEANTITTDSQDNSESNSAPNTSSKRNQSSWNIHSVHKHM